jgi:hypothetical protein
MGPTPTPTPEDQDRVPTDTKRVNAVFSNDTYNTLQNIAQSQGISVSDALRQAISISDLVVKANQNPDSRVLIDNGGNVQEVKLIR